MGVMLSGSVIAGMFSVTPVRIYMASNERASAVTVTNDGDEELVMQSDIYDWQQNSEGQDVLSLSEDMILSPPILKMAPRSHQVLRLISLNTRSKDRQHTYRMIIRQVAEAKPSKDNMQLQIAYAFSIPIFITPPNAEAKLECVLANVVPDIAKAICQNYGTATAHTRAIQISSASGESMARHDSASYILPGAQKSFIFKESHSAIPVGRHRLVVFMNDGKSQSYDMTVGD
jgi:fimbrial chaperone protein